MNNWPPNPSVYEINAFHWLSELKDRFTNINTLEDVPEEELNTIASYGFTAIWLMGVWTRSIIGAQIAASIDDLKQGYCYALPDCQQSDIAGSPFSISKYEVDPFLGGNKSLKTFRMRLAKRGIRLMLDFVPNHLGHDHRWMEESPDFFVNRDGTEIVHEDRLFFSHNNHSFAFGRSLRNEIWTDTVQIDIRKADVRKALAEQLAEIAGMCDAIRCDMAMLATQQVFLKTWGGVFEAPDVEFWPPAIALAKKTNSEIILVAEVYHYDDLGIPELTSLLQRFGFNCTYDKPFYDKLISCDANAIRKYLYETNFDNQKKAVRFIENHDEQRIAKFHKNKSMGFAVLMATLPGMRLFFEGQLEGYTVKPIVQLVRRLTEKTDSDLFPFYKKLLTALKNPIFQNGAWNYITPTSASFSDESWANFVCYSIKNKEEKRLVAVNLSCNECYCFVSLGSLELTEESWQLRDEITGDLYLRHTSGLECKGLYLKIKPFGFNVFSFERP